MIRPVLALAVALALLISAAHADAPLPPPHNVVSCASSGEVCAQSDPRRGITDIINKAKAEVLWSIRGWHRWLFVAEDGQSVALGYPGMNLVPVDADMQLEVMHLYNQAGSIRGIKLADLYDHRSQLARTASHLAWVRSIQVNRGNQLVLELVSGRRAVFSMRSGAREAEVRDDA